MLKKVWDSKNLNFFLESSQRYTAEGLTAYWEAVDRTVRYYDSVLLKKQDKKKLQRSLESSQKDRFQWQNPSLNGRFEDQDKTTFKKLPPPPPVRGGITRNEF